MGHAEEGPKQGKEGDGDGMEANGSRVRRTGGAEDHGSGGYCVRWRGTEGGGDERTVLLWVSWKRESR